MSDLIDGQQIYFGTCISSDDPLMLGRIRVEPETFNQAALAGSNPKFNPNSNDPNKNGTGTQARTEASSLATRFATTTTYPH